MKSFKPQESWKDIYNTYILRITYIQPLLTFSSNYFPPLHVFSIHITYVLSTIFIILWFIISKQIADIMILYHEIFQGIVVRIFFKSILFNDKKKAKKILKLQQIFKTCQLEATMKDIVLQTKTFSYRASDWLLHLRNLTSINIIQCMFCI